MPLTCWSRCDATTAYCSIRFDRKVAICMKSVTHCWLLKAFSCSEDLASSRSRRTNRNPSCCTRAISSSRCWPSIEAGPPTLLDQNDTLVTSESGLALRAAAAVRVFHFTDLQRDFDLSMKVRNRYIRAPWPAMTMIGVAELAQPGLICEVKDVAMVPGAS